MQLMGTTLWPGAFISREDNVTYGDFGFLHTTLLFCAKMLLCFYTTCGPQAFGKLLFGSHISNVPTWGKNFSLPTHGATYVLQVSLAVGAVKSEL